MKRMNGATLAVSLLLLFVITLLGISTIQTTQMQEKMSANLQDKNRSFTAAESALAAGESWVLNLAAEPDVLAICTAFPCAQERLINVNFEEQTYAWWAAQSAPYTGSLTSVATTPRYIIEYLQFIPDSPIVGSNKQNTGGVHYYQITARGSGTTDDAVTILQSTVARRF